MPERIQRRSTKGWRMPPNTVYVGRPSPYSNPFPVAKYGREMALEYYRVFLIGDFRTHNLWKLPEYRKAQRFFSTDDSAIEPGECASMFLRGKNLACWCSLDGDCHADVLLEVANA